jgi:hypothetical protein
MSSLDFPFARISPRGLIQLAVCAALVCILIGLDWHWFGRGVLKETAPALDLPHAFRTLTIAGIAWLGLNGCLVLFAPQGNPQPRPATTWPQTTWGCRLVAAVPLLVTLFLTVLMPLDPFSYNRLVIEDGLVEMLSASLAAVAGLVLIRVWLAQRSMQPPANLLARGFVILFGITCLLLAGEEVSWFQRQLGFETPESFSRNIQNEFNLHNFETDRIETAYYIWAFAMTAFAAFMREGSALVRALPWLHDILPGRHAAFAGALAVGMNYEMWNTIPTQLIFFSTIAILIGFACHPRGAAGGRWMPLAVLLLLVAGQVLTITYGHTMVRRWDSTEVKELLMPLSFLIYALELRARQATPRAEG